MRYTIYSDDHLLYNPDLPEYTLTEPTLTLNVNEPGELTFGVPETNPSAGNISRLSSRIKVYRDRTLIFLGRVIQDEQDLNHVRKYTVEECLAYLVDSICRPYSFSGTPAEFFTRLLTQHNAQVPSAQQIAIGSCTVTSSETLVTRAENHYSTWELLKTKLIDQYGGYLYTTFNASGNPVLSWLASPPDTATQKIEFGENLAELAIERNASETYTACIPLGARLSDIDESSDSDERLTITSVNDNKDYLIDSTSAIVYGTLYAPVDETTWDSIATASALKTKGQQWLAAQSSRMKETINLTAVDLNNLDASIEAFHFLDRVTVSCGDICPEAQFVLTSMTIPLQDPANMRITLGDSRESLVSESNAQIGDAIDRIGVIEADYTTNGEAKQLVQQEITNNTSILQSAEQIMLTALEEYVKTSDYTAFKNTLNTTLTVMSNAIEANFTETTSEITTLNGSVSQQFQTIHSFIRLLSSGIVIGESTSEIKLKLENDILYFFTGDESSVSTENALAYFSSGKLYVNTVHILTSMRIGSFALVPEANNLNFKLME